MIYYTPVTDLFLYKCPEWFFKKNLSSDRAAGQ